MNNRYIVVQAWMMSALGLSGNDLLAYAMIYGYSQDGQGSYWGSIKHTAEALNISPRAAADVLRRLEERGVIEKINTVVDGIQRYSRIAVVPGQLENAVPQSPAPGQPITQQPQPTALPTAAPARKRCIKPTVEEVEGYCRQRNNNVNAQRFFDYYEANGWVQGRGKPIRDWRAAVRTWEQLNRNDYEREKRNGVFARREQELTADIARIDAEYRARNATGDDARAVLGGS